MNDENVVFSSFKLGMVYIKHHYTTNRQVAGSIPDGVIGIFQ